MLTDLPVRPVAVGDSAGEDSLENEKVRRKPIRCSFRDKLNLNFSGSLAPRSAQIIQGNTIREKNVALIILDRISHRFANKLMSPTHSVARSLSPTVSL